MFLRALSHFNATLGKCWRTLNSVALMLVQERAGRHCGALRVLNSYWVAEDSTYKYFEIILVDPMHKVCNFQRGVKL